MTPTPEEIEAAAQAEEEARKQQDSAGGMDLLSSAGDVIGGVAEVAVDVVGGVLGAIGSVFEGL